MENEFKNKKVTVVGLGKSGIASVRLLSKQGADVSITENRIDSQLLAIAEGLLKEGAVRHRFNVELGSHTEALIEGRDLVVVSPGVRNDSLPIFYAQKKNIPIISELELGFRFCPVPIVAVTGTSGKTTVATLISRVLQNSGERAIVCGNIGNPITSEIDRLKDAEFAVVEVSSFQLEWIEDFRPKISIILNISDNHLDRHRNMEEYINLKARIFQNQRGEDLVLLNGRDEIVRSLKERVNARVKFFNADIRGLHADLRGFVRNIREYPRDNPRESAFLNENFLAVWSCCSILGVDEDHIFRTLLDFRGLEHRLEFVRKLNGVGFYNDSKATTISSMKWALNSLNPKIILIAGGRYKGGDFRELKELVKEKVRFIVTIGESKRLIKDALSEYCEVIEKDTLQEAVELAFSLADSGNQALLSPGCSSFDMFKDYEERGRKFKEIVNNLSEDISYEA